MVHNPDLDSKSDQELESLLREVSSEWQVDIFPENSPCSAAYYLIPNKGLSPQKVAKILTSRLGNATSIPIVPTVSGRYSFRVFPASLGFDSQADYIVFVEPPNKEDFLITILRNKGGIPYRRSFNYAAVLGESDISH